jgi:hypothetical protein
MTPGNNCLEAKIMDGNTRGNRLSRCALVAASIVAIAIGCTESTAPGPHKQIHVRVQTTYGAAAVLQATNALTEISARENGISKVVSVAIDGRNTAVSLSEILERTKRPGQTAPTLNGNLLDHSVQPRFATAASTPTPGISYAYTLVSGPVPGMENGVMTAHMEGSTTLPLYGWMDQDVHLTTKHAGATLVDMHAKGKSNDWMGESGDGTMGALNTRADVQMEACDDISAATTHHVFDRWTSQDYYSVTSDTDPSTEDCCGSSGGGDGGGPADQSRIAPHFDKVAGPFSPPRVASFADLKTPSKANTTQDCAPPSGGGDGSTGTGSVMTICVVVDHYDGDGNYQYSETIRCWSEVQMNQT